MSDKNNELQLSELQQQANDALNRGDFNKLHGLCLSLLRLHHNHADAWFLLAICASVNHHYKKAIELIQRALAIAPSNSEYLAQKAKFHLVLNQLGPAKASADQAFALQPTRALTLDTLAVVYTKLGHYQTAYQLLLRTVALQQDNAQFYFNLAAVEQILGLAEDAAHHYREAIKLKTNFARAYWSLSELRKNNADGSLIPELTTLLDNPKISPEDELYCCHALAREYELAGHYQQAFNTLRRGKNRRKQEINYSLAEDKKVFTKLKEIFVNDTESRRILQSTSTITTDCSELGKGVIFIVGMPRTGTTLVERILSSHSEVISLGELQDFALSVRAAAKSTSQRVLDETIIEQAAKEPGHKIGKRYLESTARRRRELQSRHSYFVDKMPLNFLMVGFILRSLPAAKIVCLRRHPLDTCLSNYRQLFALNFSYYNYHYDLMDTAYYYSYFADLMTLWKQHFGARFLEVSYENLVTDPESTVREMLAYIELEWQPNCLEFHNNPAAVATASAMQVREKLYSNAIGRWKNYRDQLHEIIELFQNLGISDDFRLDKRLQ